MKAFLVCSLALLSICSHLPAQAPGVPIVKDGRATPPALATAATKLRDAGQLLSMETARQQLGRTHCEVSLPPRKSLPLSGRELWERARAAHIRVGYLYVCTKCDRLHLTLAGGYAISAGGAVATCFHVVEPKAMKVGHLVAATDAGEVMPVTEVLAGNSGNDVAIVRVRSVTPLEPLPLNTDVRPGDDAWCYSDPLGRSGYFSNGVVNRFFERMVANATSIRMNVSTDWAPGSSGSAVLDSSGNAIGHVSRISPVGGQAASGASKAAAEPGSRAYIVFHDAVRAADVLALIQGEPGVPGKE